MDELFGASVNVIAAVLGVIVAVFGVVLLYIAVRNPILVRMAFRSVWRRPARSALIIVGFWGFGLFMGGILIWLLSYCWYWGLVLTPS